VARWTWAIDAQPSGTGSKLANRVDTVAPSSFSMMVWMRSTGIGATLSCIRSSAVANSTGTMSGRVDSIWPSLTKVGPSDSRSVTNCSGLPSGGTSGAPAASRFIPEKTPELR